jgi:cellulose synthase/poly-beta-1,6-N-acetylglucosamine synthase-like glycosyltransferase
MELPRASVIVTAKNEERTVKRCITALTKQDYPNYEILFVDAGSKDATLRTVQELAGDQPNIKILTNLGTPSTCRNLAIKASNSEIIAFTDADVEVPSTWLKSLAETLLSAPDVGGAGGPNVPTREVSGEITRVMDLMLTTRLGSMQSAQSFDHGELVEVKSIPCCNSAYARNVLEEIGGFDEELVGCDDTDLGFRVRFTGRRILFQPSARVLHLVRFHTLRQFARMMFKYGRGRGYASRRRHYLFSGPAIPAVGLIAGVPLVLLTAAVLHSIIPLVFFPLLYVVALAGYSIFIAISKRDPIVAILGPVMLGVEHLSYSIGFLRGLLDRKPSRWSG